MAQNISDWLKPHRSEALGRIRLNAFVLIVITLISTLVPHIPTLPRALTVAISLKTQRRTSFYASFCLLEVGLVALLLINIVQSLLALKYPRAPIPPSPAPVKAKSLRAAPATPQKILALSPNSSPQPQKSFSFSTSGSLLQQSSTSVYPPSPLSTPSRVLQYSMAPGSSTNSLASSSPSTMYTPSPILSSYHGKHNRDHLARSFDGAYLSELRHQPDESDEE